MPASSTRPSILQFLEILERDQLKGFIRQRDKIRDSARLAMEKRHGLWQGGIVS